MNHINRQIFTTRPTRLEVIADYALGIVIAVSLTMAALSYFDIFTK